MPEVCKLLIEIRKGRTWETWPRATFSFQSVSTEIHCRTGVRVGKAKTTDSVNNVKSWRATMDLARPCNRRPLTQTNWRETGRTLSVCCRGRKLFTKRQQGKHRKHLRAYPIDLRIKNRGSFLARWGQG